jgi:hypothetical protein
MFEIGYSTALFSALSIGLVGFVLGVLATFLYWMKSEDGDLRRGYIEIAGNCYRLQPMEPEPPSSDATRR